MALTGGSVDLAGDVSSQQIENDQNEPDVKPITS